jgi:transposase-like protein
MRGRPPVCPHCRSTRSVRKGLRRTKQLGVRQIRRCKDCGRKFTPRNQKPRGEMAGKAPHEPEAQAAEKARSPTAPSAGEKAPALLDALDKPWES